jgi:hypothetical protein
MNLLRFRLNLKRARYSLISLLGSLRASDFQPNLATTAFKRNDREPLSSLLSIAINGTRKTP